MLVSDVHILSIVLHMPGTHSIHCSNSVVRQILFECFAVPSNRVAIAMLFQLFQLSFETAAMTVIREPVADGGKTQKLAIRRNSI